MKVGDFVGIAGTWDDDLGYEMLGIIIGRHFDTVSDCHIIYTIHGKAEYWDQELLEVIF